MRIEFGRDNESRRQRWVEDALSKVPEGSRILDAGAGELRNKKYCKHLVYVSQDICVYEGTGDGNALQTGTWDTSKIDIVSDISSIPQPDSSFDAIVCTEVLEHLPNPHLAVKEFSRLLRPGGLLVVTAPFGSLTHFAPFHFSTGFSRYWYEKQMAENDFELLRLESSGGWFDVIAQELWRLPKVGRQYGPGFLGWIALAVALPLLGILKLMQLMDKGSGALQTFGWHALAVRQH